jgi:hypothetical protein
MGLAHKKTGEFSMNSDFIIGGRNPQVVYEAQPNRSAPTPSRYEVEGEAARPAKAASNIKAAENSPNLTNNGPGADDNGDFSFGDFLDVINPLQHIPIISQIYRAVTGDTISGFAQVAGGAIFGGPIGLVTGAIGAIFEDETGKSMPETMVAGLFGGDEDPTKAPVTSTQLASNDVQTDDEGNEVTQPVAARDVPPTLNKQLAAAELPPMTLPPIHVASNEKLPYGGVINLAAVPPEAQPVPKTLAEQEKKGLENGRQILADAATDAAEAKAHPPVSTVDGHKFYSLANVRRMSGGTDVAMPINRSPDVRLKPLSRQAYEAPKAPLADPAQTTVQKPTASAYPPVSPGGMPPGIENDAARALGLSAPAAPVASNAGTLTPGDADLFPTGRGSSQALPPALIEDMMKQGLEKYQRGLQNGTIGTQPRVDIQG